MDLEKQQAQGKSTGTSPSPATVPVPKAKPGAAWKANEQHVLPQNRLVIVFIGLMMCTFLAALVKLFTSWSISA